MKERGTAYRPGSDGNNDDSGGVSRAGAGDGPGSRKGIYILPNLFTTASLFAAFYAIVHATKGDFGASAAAIFVAMVMDGLDGRVARMTQTTSDFGKEYDSLADMIAFGLAPALVMYEWSLSGAGKLGWLVAFIFVAATALRLARFNTQDVKDKRFFQGLPSPSGAAVMAAAVWLAHSTGYSGGSLRWPAMLLTVAAALAMVSSFPYRSFKDFDLKGRVPFLALLVVVAVFVLISFDPPLVLFTCFAAYLVSGPAIATMRWRRKRAMASRAESRREGGEAAGGDFPDRARGPRDDDQA